MYDKLAAKVNDIDTSGFALKPKYGIDKLELEKKIPNTSVLVKNKIPSTSGLATNATLTAVEYKLSNVSSLVK